MISKAIDPAKLCDLYLRRSTLQDNKDTLRAHERDLRSRAAREGLTVREVWTDEVSAFKAGVIRENFDNAIAAVVAGKVRHLLVWKLDRLSRKGMKQVGDVLETFESKGARLLAHMDGLDSSVPQHRGLFAWLAEQARAESYNTSVRTRATKAEKKRQGAWPGGQPPYGLRVLNGKKCTEHNPKEYETARRIADALLAGESAASIAEKLNADTLTTRRGGKWRSTSITQLAHSPAWAGLMPQHERYTDDQGRERWRPTDEPLIGDDGQPVRVGAGVITTGERARILAGLRSRTSESLANGRRGKPAAQSLLSGLLKCGRCGGNMTKAGPQYRCYRRVNLGKSACQGMAVLVTETDNAMATAFVGRIPALEDDDDTLAELAVRWLAVDDPEKDARRIELTLAVQDAQTRLDDLDAANYVHGRFKGAARQHQYDTMRDAIDAQLQSFTTELEAITGALDITVLRNGEMLASAWENADQEQARMLLRVVLHSVTVLPPRGQGCKDPVLTRFRCHWVGEQPEPLTPHVPR
ncbi:recombinase family protein [Streptacidiphilus sp. EB103A]|uniref:recombinase family protein n=1 Tax=Streptacidiphilus sp. EB103A TaxID=3156275 RepID=UPI0035148DBE